MKTRISENFREVETCSTCNNLRTLKISDGEAVNNFTRCSFFPGEVACNNICDQYDPCDKTLTLHCSSFDVNITGWIHAKPYTDEIQGP